MNLNFDIHVRPIGHPDIPEHISKPPMNDGRIGFVIWTNGYVRTVCAFPTLFDDSNDLTAYSVRSGIVAVAKQVEFELTGKIMDELEEE